jgi:thioredoxin:protein disulfide reductase
VRLRTIAFVTCIVGVPAIVGVFMPVDWYHLPPDIGAAHAELTWESNETIAASRAESDHRPMLIDFGASWCGACQQLEERTFPDPRVREQGARFVALHVDATDDDNPDVADIREKYHATEGLPVVLLFDSHGAEAVRFTEFVPPDRLSAAMMRVQ